MLKISPPPAAILISDLWHKPKDRDKPLNIAVGESIVREIGMPESVINHYQVKQAETQEPKELEYTKILITYLEETRAQHKDELKTLIESQKAQTELMSRTLDTLERILKLEKQESPQGR